MTEEYVQLSSWEELIAWLEREGDIKVHDYQAKTVAEWNRKPKRKNKKTPPQREGLF